MSFLRKLSASLSTPAPKAAVDRHLAMAVLLLETARADFERGPDELELIREQLAHGLKLDAAQTEALIARATDSAGDRKTVGLGKGVAVRGELGGRRNIKKKTSIHNTP